jgi:PAS domain S-box-containing protein
MDYILLIEGSNSFGALFRNRVGNALNVDVVIANSLSAAKQLLADRKNHFSMAVLGGVIADAPNDEAVDFILSKGIPTIVLTADYNKDLQQNLLNKGVLDYFVKDGVEVIDSVTHAIDHYIHNKNIHILVVDDSRSIRAHLNTLLSRYGYKVFMAEDGRVALRLVNEQRVDLIISDYQMPNMDDLQMVKKLRTRFLQDEIAVIGLSSQDNSDLAVQFIKSGANDFLPKPYRAEELLCRVFQNIDLIERRKELGSLIERHKSILNHALDAIITTDDTGTVLDYNPAAETLFGHKKQAVIGKKIDALIIPEEYVADHQKAIAKHCATTPRKLPLKRRMEFPGVRADGKIVELQLALTSNILNNKVNYTAFIQDITDKKRLLQSLKETLGEAEAANHAKGEFLANMSHEIRTPMNAVLGFTDLALKADISDKVRDYLQKTENASRSLMGIINDILDFSKVEAGRMQLDPVKFDLHQVFEHLADLFSKQVADKNIELIFLAPISYDEILFGDALRLKQILINLIRNAIKFTPHGSITVTCTPEKITTNQFRLNFSVQDTGIGVEAEVLPNLFAAFVQADSSTTRKYGGTGLGLSICKQLVTLMDGEIGVASILGEGSEFTFDVLVGRHSDSQRKKQMIPEQLWGKKALLVDDNIKVQQQISGLLQSVYLKPTVTSSGKEALDILLDSITKRSPYEFVFIDWDMPTGNGLAAATKILATLEAESALEQIPRIFLLTPVGSDAIQTEGEKLGINGFLDKPVTRSRMIRTIVQDLERKSISKDRRIKKTLGHEEKTGEKIGGARVLLAEDNEINQQIALELLHRVGIIVEVATNGEEALAMALQFPFDAVIMDIQMPIMDGLEATRHIRLEARLQNLPIIAITANSQPEEIKHCLDAGMNSHLDKPIRPERLYGLLSKWIQIIEPPIPTDLLLSKDGDDELPNIVGIDTKDGLQRVAGNRKLYRRLLSRFLSEHGNTTEKIREALRVENFSEVAGYLHTIKGVSGYIGAISLCNTTEIFEEAINKGSKKDRKAAMATFSNHLNAIIDGLGGAQKTDVVQSSSSPILENFDIQLDRQIVEPLILELAGHFKNNSLSYGEVLSQFKKILEPTKAMIIFGELEKQLNDYHFVESLEILQKIASPLNIDLSGNLFVNIPKPRETVLIVDDQRSNVDLLKDIMCEFNLFVALNGRKALEMANSENQPDIILLDIMMPEMNGYEVCRRLKESEKTRDIPVIFVTAKNEVNDEAEGFLVGGVDYITKPFHADIIKQRVIRCLSLKRHQNHLEELVAVRTIELENAKQVAEAGRTAAEAGNRAKSAFLSHMSHEIRTPLNAILGMGELLLETEINNEQRLLLQTNHRASQSLHALVNDILDLSKIEADQLVLDQDVFELRDIIDGIIEIFTINAKEKKIKLHCVVDENVPRFTFGDPARLRQILLNLVGNAVKFTMEGHIEVGVHTGPNSNISFVITDTGPGILKEKQEEIFKSFTQAETFTTRKHGGTGLGLTICQQLVLLMGGEIRLESKIDQGSTFTCNIPLPIASKENIPDKIARKHSMPGRGDESIILGNNFKVLLVEDAEENRMVVQGYLKHTQCQLEIAKNGLEGVTKFKNSAFDLVLMDIQMPVMDGYTATRKIREWEAETGADPTPIVALTAHALTEESQKIKEAGCNQHLLKPISKARLIEVLQSFQQRAGSASVDTSPKVHTSEIQEANSKKLHDTGNLMTINIVTLDELRRDVGGNINRQLEKLINNLPNRLDAISDAVINGDPDALSKAAHKLKGTAATFGAEKIAHIANQLDLHGQSGQIMDAGNLVTSIMAEGEMVKVELKKILNRDKP